MTETFQNQGTEQKPLRILIIQLGNLSESIQCLMALRAAKQLYPYIEIHTLSLARSHETLQRIPWISSSTLLHPEQLAQSSNGLSDLAKWITPLIDQPWDILLNWSYSESSSYLCALLPARVKLGYSRKSDLSLSADDGWTHYIQAILQEGIEQDIHITDILTTQLLTALQIHAGDPVDAGNQSVTSKTFFTLNISDENKFNVTDPTRKWVGIQLGASDPNRTLSPEKWAKTIRYILDRHPEFNVVLLGEAREISRAHALLLELKTAPYPADRLVSLVGETDFDLWASVIARCQWLMTADSAAIHLASILGTRVLNLSIGGQRFWETGPYGNGHYVVSSSHNCPACIPFADSEIEHSCHADMTPEAIYATFAYGSSEWAHRRQFAIQTHFSRLGFSSELEKLQIYRSKIRNTDDGGGVVYEPMLDRPLSLQSWSSQAFGHIARFWYCGWVPEIGQDLKRPMITPHLVGFLRQLDDSSQVLNKIFSEASRTALQIREKSLKLKSETIMRIEEKSALIELQKKLEELENLVERLALAQPTLKFFYNMSKVLNHNHNGQQISDLGEETAQSYLQLEKGTALLREWVKLTLQMVKPVALNITPTKIKEIHPS